MKGWAVGDTIKARCPNCDSAFRLKKRQLENAIKCPKCKNTEIFKPVEEPKPPEENEFEVLKCSKSKGIIVELLQYKNLKGSSNIHLSNSLFYAKEVGIKLKCVRIHLDNASLNIEPGALHYMHGKLELSSSASGGEGIVGIGKALARKALTKETVFQSKISGTGTVYLEPSFGHYILYELNNEELVVDKGMYYCSDSKVKCGVSMQKNVSSALFGGEGLFQTKVTGTGICVFDSPVPIEEVRCINLKNEKLSVDGNFALMRTEGISFKAEKSAKSLVGMLGSGELLLQTFSGTGKVWIAPTEAVYDEMDLTGGVNSQANNKGGAGSFVRAIGELSS
jgi:uncharacterized protein (AIM24 family)